MYKEELAKKQRLIEQLTVYDINVYYFVLLNMNTVMLFLLKCACIINNSEVLFLVFRC